MFDFQIDIRKADIVPGSYVHDSWSSSCIHYSLQQLVDSGCGGPGYIRFVTVFLQVALPYNREGVYRFEIFLP